MGGPFNLQFANHFIIYQKRPFRGRFGTGRLHSELWAWGVKRLNAAFQMPIHLFRNFGRTALKIEF